MIDQPKITATVKMEAEDIYRGFIAALTRKAGWYSAQIVFVFVFLFLVNPQFLSPVKFIVVGLILILYLAIYIYWISSKSIKTNQAYRDPIEYSFQPSGLEATGPSSFFHHDWCNFISVNEDSRMFIFYPSDAQFLVVPKRSFADSLQIDALRNLLRTSYPGKLKLKH
ncbi:MAG: YcxB family protein [Candidatus Acidiferrum sp.]